MKTLFAIFATALAILAPVDSAYSQQQSEGVRIGFLGTGAPFLYKARIEAFKTELAKRGYVEGQNIGIEYRYAGGNRDRLAPLAAELAQLDVKVIVATSTPSARAAKKASSTIPIVMHAGNPVKSGLVVSLARPGGNITGLTVISGPEFYGKRLALLQEMVPSARQIAVLWNPENAAHPPSMNELQVAAQDLRISLLSLEARNASDIDSVFATIDAESPEGLLNLGDALFNTHRKRIVEFVANSQIPSIYTHGRYVRAGGLMSYGVNFVDLYRRMAIYVDKILKGANPGDLPIERPRRFDLTINLKAARALGISIPPSLLLRANKVIE